MKNFINKGFTLIELIIVIAILGIMAAGLLAALDPLEQIRRANDSTVRNSALETSRAYDRYYTITSSSGTASYPACAAAADAPLTVLFNVGELKSVNGSLVATLNAGGKPKTCFTITSKSFKLNPLTKYGGAIGNCGTASAANGCTGAGTASSTCTIWCDQ